MIYMLTIFPIHPLIRLLSFLASFIRLSELIFLKLRTFTAFLCFFCLRKYFNRIVAWDLDIILFLRVQLSPLPSFRIGKILILCNLSGKPFSRGFRKTTRCSKGATTTYKLSQPCLNIYNNIYSFLSFFSGQEKLFTFSFTVFLFLLHCDREEMASNAKHGKAIV